MEAINGIRLFSLALVAGFLALVPRSEWYSVVVLCLGLGHYLVSLIYSWGQAASIARTPSMLLPALVIGLVGYVVLVAPYDHSYKLFLYFAAHHVFNEVYVVQRSLGLRDGTDAGLFRLSAGLLHTFIYFSILCFGDFLSSRAPTLPSGEVLWAGLALSSAFFAFSLMRVRSQLRGSLLQVCICEVVGLVVAAAALNRWIYVHFTDVVLYHFVFWAIYPVTLLKGGRPAVVSYSAINGAAIAAIAVACMIWSTEYRSGLWIAFYVLSYFHITISAMVSAAHPAWIRRWFRPAVRVAA